MTNVGYIICLTDISEDGWSIKINSDSSPSNNTVTDFSSNSSSGNKTNQKIQVNLVNKQWIIHIEEHTMYSQTCYKL